MRNILFLISIFIIATVSVGLTGCGGSDEEQVRYMLQENATTREVQTAPKIPDGNEVHGLKTHIVPGRLKNIFNDSNHVQLPAAKVNGIAPIVDLRTAFYLKQPIQRIRTTDLYYVDSMKHATPYLVPKAATLLKEIAKAFHDTIIARGGKDYRIRVTSMLRTNYSVAQLQKHNRAASSQSCHLYGTTFDISWVKFDSMNPGYQISLESLKNILAEIVYDFRQRGKCYAIFENKQGCFHITAR